MKKLILLRHASAASGAASGRDFDRPLDQNGRTAARTMGTRMKQGEVRVELGLASPAARVAETLKELGEGLGALPETQQDERIYLASAETLLDLIRETDDNIGSLLLVGHNPGLQNLLATLTGDTSSFAFPTAGVAEIDLPVDRWADLQPGTGLLYRFMRADEE
jgi:phosphohistidine phosphatase